MIMYLSSKYQRANKHSFACPTLHSDAQMGSGTLNVDEGDKKDR